MNYKEALDFIFGRTNYELVPRPHAAETYDLRRVYELLECLGNPHLRAKSVHVTGTNGKGSTCAMLASVLTLAGFRTGLYTSPHLITMRERIAIDGQMITEAEVADLMTHLQPEIEYVNEKATYGTLTVFEILTVLAFVYFASKGCDFQVMEVGMGGRFDATNVLMPEVCVITAINYDHMEVLGDTLTKIAEEKCGIIKPGCAVVSQFQAEEADIVIRKHCLTKGVKLIRLGEDVTWEGISFDKQHQEFEIKGRFDSYTVSIPLLGHYQQDNAASAVAALEVLLERGYKISRDSIINGLAQVSFHGRLQELTSNPAVVVDGGHNPEAARNLKEALIKYYKPARFILVIGISLDKDIQGIVHELAPVFKKVIVTRANNPRSARPEILRDEFARCGIEAEIAADIPAALSMATRIADKEDMICVTGSLYVVGEVIGYIKTLAVDS